MPVDNVLGGGAKRDDMWSVTLGDAQYQWFRQTLERSRARYKFVFTHHVLGTGRGGNQAAAAANIPYKATQTTRASTTHRSIRRNLDASMVIRRACPFR